MILGGLLDVLVRCGCHAGCDVEHSAARAVRERSAAASFPAGDRTVGTQYRGIESRWRNGLSPAIAGTGGDVSGAIGCDCGAWLAERFGALTPEHASIETNIELEIEGRPIRCRRSADDVAWFDFVAVCDGPRSQNDYIELARIYPRGAGQRCSGVHGRACEDQARRFISLVDEFYDHNVKLIVSAAAPVETLYQGERLAFEFERTRSRLLEMRSHEYLSRTHRA